MAYPTFYTLHSLTPHHLSFLFQPLYRVDAVLEIDKAAQVTRHVPYDGRVAADKQNADNKSWVAAPYS